MQAVGVEIVRKEIEGQRQRQRQTDMVTFKFLGIATPKISHSQFLFHLCLYNLHLK